MTIEELRWLVVGIATLSAGVSGLMLVLALGIWFTERKNK